MVDKSETALQHSIIVALEQMGVWVIRTPVRKKRSKLGVRAGEDGMPDLWTEFGWIEVKLPGEPLRYDQKVWHAKAKGRGIRVAVADSVSDAVAVIQAWVICDRGKLGTWPPPTVGRDVRDR